MSNTTTIVTYDMKTKTVICEGTLAQCAAAMLAAEAADVDSDVSVNHMEDGLLKSLTGGELRDLRKLLIA